MILYFIYMIESSNSLGEQAKNAYTVKAWDTLSKIAKDRWVDIDKLAAANGIKDKNKIRVGQELKMPDKDRVIRTYQPASKAYAESSRASELADQQAAFDSLKWLDALTGTQTPDVPQTQGIVIPGNLEWVTVQWAPAPIAHESQPAQVVEITPKQLGKIREITLMNGNKISIIPDSLKLTSQGSMPAEFTLNGVKFVSTGEITWYGNDGSVHKYTTEAGDVRYFRQVDRKPGTPNFAMAQERGEARFPDMKEVEKPKWPPRFTGNSQVL